MRPNRRSFIARSAGLLAASQIPEAAMAASDIKLGSILDTSGLFDIYGKPMDQAVLARGDQRHRRAAGPQDRGQAVRLAKRHRAVHQVRAATVAR
jgi:hypothetical protein